MSIHLAAEVDSLGIGKFWEFDYWIAGGCRGDGTSISLVDDFVPWLLFGAEFF